MKRANENLDLPATGDTTTSNASQEVEQVEDLDEAKFTPAQISALQKAYAPLKGKTDYKSATGSKMNFNKLKNKMKSYSISHLRQLSTSGIPMVSDAAKELLARDKRFAEETITEAWQYEMEIEYGDSMDDDQETIVVFGNIRGATLESQADRKYDQLEKQMQKKYGRDAMIDGGTMRGKTNDRSRGGSNPTERKDI